jgi:heme/copper-type cytochrome/quinol oxidase subunit 4
MQAIVAPVIAFIALIIQLVFGIDLDESQKQVITDGFVAFALALTAIIGVVKGIMKKVKEKKEQKA